MGKHRKIAKAYHKRAVVSCVGALMEKNTKSRLGRMVCNLCDHYIMGNPLYVIMLGIIGTVITTFDVIRTMNCKVSIQCSSGSKKEDLNELRKNCNVFLISILGGRKRFETNDFHPRNRALYINNVRCHYRVPDAIHPVAADAIMCYHR
ncbi:PREDICTED: uncharacterized protein LOC107074291 isoform X2 [Polistes dominula]|uniref:Uncharacterized protein LOC107074291 isoform X2 n=1 Tax=Polistes dominula TaxID=743375 RepID=A0ABM1JF17_POLDO|nr:PREDICTED: uncharacterized protein LOC107074291 isoform X2 [Polistes dominula]